MYNSVVKGDMPTISYPEQTRAHSERFRGTHILTVLEPTAASKCVALLHGAPFWSCPAECIYIEAGEHPNPEVEKFPLRNGSISI